MAFSLVLSAAWLDCLAQCVHVAMQSWILSPGRNAWLAGSRMLLSARARPVRLASTALMTLPMIGLTVSGLMVSVERMRPRWPGLGRPVMVPFFSDFG